MAKPKEFMEVLSYHQCQVWAGDENYHSLGEKRQGTSAEGVQHKAEELIN